MRRSISKKWDSLAKVAEVMKLNSEQEIKPKCSDVRALVLHTELLPPSGVKMIRVCCICINVFSVAYRKTAMLIISVTWLMFSVFSSSRWDALTQWAPSLPGSSHLTAGLTTWPLRTPLLPLSWPHLYSEGCRRVGGRCPCRLAHLTGGSGGEASWCCGQVSGH